MISEQRILLDASVFIAAAASESGGSSAAITFLTASDRYDVVVSSEILREAVGNTRLKLSENALVRLYNLLGELHPTLVTTTEASSLADLPATFPATDNHVIHACRNGEVSICLTLDRRHLLTDDVRRWGLRHQLRFLTPGEFLTWERLRTE